MKSIVTIFFTGMMVSFLGTLPLGTLNIAAMQISIEETVQQALYFSFGCLLVEMVYVRISLVAIDWIRKQQKLMRLLEWITVLIVLALAISSFVAAIRNEGGKNVLLNQTMHKFFLGIFLSAINPVQIPFWFGWSTVLFEKKVLQPQASIYNSYILGIGVGTFLGNAVFIFGGRWAAQKIAYSQYYLNWIIGSVFAITAIIQCVRIVKKKDGISKMVGSNTNLHKADNTP